MMMKLIRFIILFLPLVSLSLSHSSLASFGQAYGGDGLHPDIYHPHKYQAYLEHAAKADEYLSNGYMISCGVSGEETSAIVLDVAFTGMKDIQYESLELFARNTSGLHGDTVSYVLAGSSMSMPGSSKTLSPLAKKAAIHPVLSSDRKLHLDIGREFTTVNTYVMDKIESIISECKAQKKPVPHVINMSMALVFLKATLMEDVARFSKILKDNDLLLVKAMGNRGRTYDGLPDDNPYGRDIQLDASCTDITQQLVNFSELAERTILVGALDTDPLVRLWQSTNRPGPCGAHAIYAPHSSTLDNRTHGATSHATPRVSSLAVVLRKYFKSMSMIEIKKAILSTAIKPGQYTERDISKWGRGILSSLHAWAECTKQCKRQEPAPLKAVATVPAKQTKPLDDPEVIAAAEERMIGVIPLAYRTRTTAFCQRLPAIDRAIYMGRILQIVGCTPDIDRTEVLDLILDKNLTRSRIYQLAADINQIREGRARIAFIKKFN